MPLGTRGPGLLLAACALLTGCGDDEGHRTSSSGLDEPVRRSCKAGSLGCACRDDDGCEGDTECLQGFCVPKCDEPGTEGCPCHPDGMCGVLEVDGEYVPMSCIGNICRKTVQPRPGLWVARAPRKRAATGCGASRACASGPDALLGRLGARVDRTGPASRSTMEPYGALGMGIVGVANACRVAQDVLVNRMGGAHPALFVGGHFA